MSQGYYFIIELQVYPYDIMVSIDEKDKKLFKRLINLGIDKKEIKLAKFSGSGRTIIFKTNQTLIRINTNKLNIHNSISHEIFHAVNFIMDKMGNKFKLHINDEIYAYLIGFVTEQVYKKLK